MTEKEKNVQQENGSNNFFSHVYREYMKPVYGYLYRRVGKSREIAEDLVQETFLRAWRHLPKLKEHSAHALQYLMRIAKSRLITYYRKKKTVPLPENIEVIAEPIIHEESLFNSDEVWAIIDTLPKNDKQALTMKYRENLKIKEIATKLNKSENAVKILLSRARKVVQKRVAEKPESTTMKPFDDQSVS